MRMRTERHHENPFTDAARRMKNEKRRAKGTREIAGISRNEAVKGILEHMFTSYSVPLLADNPRRSMVAMLLMVAKLQDKEVLKDDSLIRAKLVAKLVEQTGSLAVAIPLVLLAIETDDKRFFIDFGKCLSSDIKPTLFDKRDRDIAEIVLFNPQMSAKRAVRELAVRGHRGITVENFRMWKMRLLKAKPKFNALIARIA
jgi:hypothetical protein